MPLARETQWLVVATVATATMIVYTACTLFSMKQSISSGLFRPDPKGQALTGPNQKGRGRKGRDQKGSDPRDSAQEPIDESIIREQLARNYAFFGDERMERVREATIAVFGLGGVGSWAAVMLARSGVKKLLLVDFDQVSLSSLNRHAAATLTDVGLPKARVLKDAITRFAPWVDIDARVEIADTETIPILLRDRPSFVIDCIDNIATKSELLAYCKQNEIPVVSSMGSGCKSDSSRVVVGDISESIEDPLSRTVRRLLRLRGIECGVPVVFSAEKPDPEKAALLPLDQSLVGQDASVLPDFRARILPVVGTMPGIFGLNCANFVLMSIAKYPLSPMLYKNRPKTYVEVVSLLKDQSLKLFNSSSISLDASDAGLLLDEIFRAQSVLPPFRKSRTILVVWKKDFSDGCTRDNVVCMTKEEANTHIKEVLLKDESVDNYYPAAVLDLIAKRQREINRIYNLFEAIGDTSSVDCYSTV